MTTEALWLGIGFSGQALFAARFLAQWIASERKKDSVVPVAFWWLSLAGGLTLLSYAIYKQDKVIITGQALGLFVYVRNLMLVVKANRRAAKRQARAAASLARPAILKPHAGEARHRASATDQTLPFS